MVIKTIVVQSSALFWLREQHFLENEKIGEKKEKELFWIHYAHLEKVREPVDALVSDIIVEDNDIGKSHLDYLWSTVSDRFIRSYTVSDSERR